jgi:hypothetical protein
VPTFKKIDGVTVNEFTIDSTGTSPYKLVATNANLEVRTGAGALANISVANLPATDNQVQILTIPLVGDGSNPGAVSSTATLPQNSYVTEIRVVTTVAFNLGVPLLDIGTVDTPSLYADDSQFNLGLANTVILQPWTAQPNATSREVVCTLTATGGNPTAGASTVVVFYVVQPLS